MQRWQKSCIEWKNIIKKVDFCPRPGIILAFWRLSLIFAGITTRGMDMTLCPIKGRRSAAILPDIKNHQKHEANPVLYDAVAMDGTSCGRADQGKD